jgi:hypothetical protein
MGEIRSGRREPSALSAGGGVPLRRPFLSGATCEGQGDRAPTPAPRGRAGAEGGWMGGDGLPSPAPSRPSRPSRRWGPLQGRRQCRRLAVIYCDRLVRASAVSVYVPHPLSEDK